jgi:hypothetical protein
VARDPYKIARQEHLGDALDDLQRRGRISWSWDYDNRRSRAIYNVAEGTGASRSLDTKQAEQLVQRHHDDIGVIWRAVPSPGGETQREAVDAWIAKQIAIRS